ncbi:unnamed protein product [Adineta ricciae]|uniref:Uncharacterized protein n=1 Tax=Adineta ricciae TaxID=249248 RepID=A0A815KU99_ADIRI|nr:unnamed protein product [Adineta ricciae]
MCLKYFFNYLYKQIHAYNLFATEADIGNDNDNNQLEQSTTILQHQKYSTWLYVLLVLTSLYIIFYIALLQPHPQKIAVLHLTPNAVEQLRLKHSSTLTCPCTKANIPYKTFVTTVITLHPICSSIFVTDQWIRAFYINNTKQYHYLSFQRTAYAQFKLLANLCTFCNNIKEQHQIDLRNRELVSVELLSEKQLHTQIKSIVEYSKHSTATRIISYIDYLRTTTRTNRFMLMSETNAHVDSSHTTDSPEQKYVFTALWNLLLEIAPTGDSTCYGMNKHPLFESILTALTGHAIHWNVTNYILPVQEQNNTVYDYLRQIFINEWLTNANYSIYFETCAPAYCTYSATQQTKFFGALTLIISLYGGLILIYRLLTPSIIEIVMKVKNRSTNNHNNRIHLRTCPRYFVDWLKQINLFATNADRTEENIAQEKIITRVHLILFSSAFIIIILSTSLKSQTVTKIISDPAWDDYSYHQLSCMNKLKCPCSSITTSYDKFITLSVILHRICSSDFVTERWRSILNSLLVSTNENKDWLNPAKSQFQFLSDLCILANKTVNNAIEGFLMNDLISLNVIVKDDFNKQFNAILIEFFRSITVEFAELIKTVRLVIQVDQPFNSQSAPIQDKSLLNLIGNEVISEEDNQLLLKVDFGLNAFPSTNTSSRKCICATNKYCRRSLVLQQNEQQVLSGIPAYDYALLNNVEGCFSIDSLFLSTVECLHLHFNCSTILRKLLKSFHTGLIIENPWNDARPLVYDEKSSKFPPNSSIEVIVENVMIEKWNSSISYASYYKSCAPKFCTCSIEIRATLIQILTTIVSMISGITLASQLLTPYLVKFVLSLKVFIFTRQSTAHLQVTQVPVKFFDKVINIMKTFFKHLNNVLINLNIFHKRDFGTDTDRTTAKSIGQWATRIYFILLVSALIGVALYTITEPDTLTKAFNEPTFDSYNHLKHKYDDKLRCSCLSISSTYKQYVTIVPIFHQICKSQFISEKWRDDLTRDIFSNLSIYDIKDYRRFLSAHLQFLQGLCELSIESVKTSIDQFLSSFLVTTELLSESEFQSRIHSNIYQMKSKPKNKIAQILHLIRYINHGNGIISTYGTNFQYVGTREESADFFIKIISVIYDNECSCAMHHNCTTQAKFLQTNSTEATLIVGLKMGCTPSESLLSSTLECFFNSSCIKLIQKYASNQMSNDSFAPLSTTNMKRFSTNATVNELINELFVEDLNTTTDYLSYFQHCKIEFCSYTYIQKLNSFYTLTLLIGFQGGLTIVLRWLTPKLVKIILQVYRYRKKQRIIVQSNTTIQIASNELNNRNILCKSTSNSMIARTIQSTAQFSCKILLKWMLAVVIVILTLTIFSILFARYQFTKETTTKPTNMTNSTINNNCSIIFQSRSICNWIISPSDTHIHVADMNDDLHNDIIISSSQSNEISILFGFSNATIENKKISLNTTIRFLLIGDFNNDKCLDFVINSGNNFIDAYLGNGNYEYSSPISTILTDFHIEIVKLDMGDFNHDNILDLACLNSFDTVIIMMGSGNGSFPTQNEIHIPDLGSKIFASSFAITDVNNDSHLDIITTGIFMNQIRVFVLFGNGQGLFNVKMFPTQYSFLPIHSVIVNDFDNDALSDFIIFYECRPMIKLISNIDYQQLDLTVEYIIDTGLIMAHPIRIVDFDGDGYQDIIGQNPITNGTVALFGNGYKFFKNMTIFTGENPIESHPFAVNDLNSDNYKDIIMYNPSNQTIDIILSTNKC